MSSQNIQGDSSYNNISAAVSSSSSSNTSAGDKAFLLPYYQQSSNTLFSNSWISNSAINIFNKAARILVQRVQPKSFNYSLLPYDLAAHILSFLGKTDLRESNIVSHFVQIQTNIASKQMCKREHFLPESLPIGVTYTDLLLNRFPHAIGPEFWREHLGEVANVPPIPRRFIEPAPGLGLN